MTARDGETGPSLDRVVVLAGGGSRRLGSDKAAADLGGVAALDRLLDELVARLPGVPVVVVGPSRRTTAAVSWRREDPPGGGPVAGIDAGTAGLADEALVAVLAGDLPFAAPALATLRAALVSAGPRADSAIGVDETGHDQVLLGVHRCGPLRRAVGDRPAGQSVRRVVGRLTVVRVPLTAPATLDVDTPADLAAARAAHGAPGRGGC